jgi:hypothetical protein
MAAIITQDGYALAILSKRDANQCQQNNHGDCEKTPQRGSWPEWQPKPENGFSCSGTWKMFRKMFRNRGFQVKQDDGGLYRYPDNE